LNCEQKTRALELLSVSRETLSNLEIFESLLHKWNRSHNLVSSRTLTRDFWWRHVADSAQLLQNAPPEAKAWADIGSGAGFPGLVLAILLKDRSGALVHLIESDLRKCAFLRNVSRETGAAAIVHHGRAEEILNTIVPLEVITARAVASLAKLASWSLVSIENGATGLFLKGKDHAKELTGQGLPDTLQFSVAASVTDPQSSVVIVRRSRSSSPSTPNADHCPS